MDNDLLDMIASGEDGSATEIHDKIKEILYNKAAENIDLVKPAVTADMFGGPNPYLQDEGEVETEPADGTPSSVEDTAEVEAPVAEAEPVDDEVEEEQPEA
tara:strand:- start:1511 stop:1813 length:303 start_codon:yes stop_codon:yes gene_type:complete